MTNSVLIDSSFFYAQLDKRDKYHQAAITYARTMQQTQVVVDVALTEIAQLLQEISEQAVLRFLDIAAQSDYQLEALTKVDLARAREVKAIYATARLDFVDCCIVAVAERLNITQICTFDRRDFSIIRPRHTDFFVLLP
ncbi:MAG: PIN domain-containing protein [bacterium]|nr:PIN domain-containing protein [bacterium]